MPFRLALSGLNAASADLSVTANNVANVATTGFKESRAEFADLYAQTQQGVSSTAIGNGVRIADVAQQFTQGNIDFTDNNLDLALSGSGFFVLSEEGALSYTRAGAFRKDNAGYITNNSGQRLQGYAPVATGGFNTGGLTDIQLTTNESPPQATTNVDVLANLPANATAPTVTPFDPTDQTTFTRATSFTAYDSLGAAHTATMYFSKTATTNTWETRLYVDGNAVGGAQTMAFSDAGALVNPATGVFTLPPYTPATGAAPMNLSLNFAGSTQFGETFAAPTKQYGFTTGRLIGIDVDATGIVQARFTNGRSIGLGQVAVANFTNPQGLSQLGDTKWAETFASGQPQMGQAGDSGFGVMQSGALEASNVDITEQLVNMITAQRNFQANAQMISTADAITQTIINIR